MGKKCDLSPCKKAEVKALVNAKLFSNRKISRRLKVSEASVRRIKKKIESGEELSPKSNFIFEILHNKAQIVRRRRGEKFHSDCVVQTVKHPIKIMISGKGTGRLYVVKGMMRQDQYKDVLKNRLIPQLEEWFPKGEPYIFMQDGAPCHTARSIKAFLAEQNIPLLDWPGNSPDMNTIENVWKLMKREVAKDVITNKTLLSERIIHVCNPPPQMQETVQSCIDSMPRRIKALIAAKCGTTKY
ncbi:transposable element Tcb2 transposase [Trichonephila clavipes]|nr:transposable element Tcb2 transposase [Trichonephila clavipes]